MEAIPTGISWWAALIILTITTLLIAANLFAEHTFY